MYPRAMNNIEKAGLKIIKESGLAYELKYNYSLYSGGYVANVPLLIGTYPLNQIQHFNTDFTASNSLDPPKILSDEKTAI